VKTLSIILIFCILAIILAARLYFSQQPKSISPIDFNTLKLPSTPNYCLVYGDQNSDRLRAAPTYPVSKNALTRRWQNITKHSKRVKFIKQTEDQLIYVAHSALFAFPDVIYVQFNSLGVSKTQLWMYSHAIYGHSDLGVNCKRVDGWLKQ
jgi:uncharacterized protein (DUF1499 family)